MPGLLQQAACRLRDWLHVLIIWMHDHLRAWAVFEGSTCYDSVQLLPRRQFGEADAEYYKGMLPSTELASGRGGARPIPVAYVHGGGWVSCAAEMSCMFATQLARERPVFSVNYPLSPEAKFPDALCSLLRFLRVLRQDQGYEEVIIVGDSCGASIAAMAVALLHNAELFEFLASAHDGRLKEHLSGSYPAVNLFVGISGVYDRRICSTDALLRCPSLAQAVFLRGLRWCFGCYERPLEEGEDHHSMPLDDRLKPLLKHFPESLLISSEFDPARPSSERFSAQLKALGSTCELVVYPQVPHGFANLPRLFRTSHMDVQYARAWELIRSRCRQPRAAD